MNVLVCIKRNEQNPIRRCSMHSHDAWEITVNLSGKVTSRIGEKSYDLSVGDVTVIPPNTPHDGTSEDGYVDIFLQAKKLDFSDITVIHDDDGAILSLMNMIHRLITESEKESLQVADALLDAICKYVKLYADIEPGHPAVHRLKRVIYEHISDPDFSLTKEMENLGYDKDYVRRLFKSEVGKTPLEYLTELRMDQARTLLTQASFHSIVAVAENCGFRDSFYFSTCFNKHVGIPPLKYRKRFMK